MKILGRQYITPTPARVWKQLRERQRTQADGNQNVSLLPTQFRVWSTYVIR